MYARVSAVFGHIGSFSRQLPSNNNSNDNAVARTELQTHAPPLEKGELTLGRRSTSFYRVDQAPLFNHDGRQHLTSNVYAALKAK